MDLDVRDYHRATRAEPEGPDAHWRQAVIVAVNTGPPPTVDIQEGGSTTTIPNVRYADSITSPQVGDTVWVLERDGDRLVAFRLAD